MNKLNVIGIGYRPLDKRAKSVVLNSEVVLANSRLLGIFKTYHEYEDVKDRIIMHGSVYETLDYISDNYRKKKISLLSAGDPMFFGIGRLVVEKLGRDAVEIYPDLSSIQVAFSRIKEPWSEAFFMSLHGGPDPVKRRKLEYEIKDIPSLLQRHNKIAILTDKQNNPIEIAKGINSSLLTARLSSSTDSTELVAGLSSLPKGSPKSPHSSLIMYVCEKLGYADEKITEGTPQDIAKMSFSDPNVVIIQNTLQTTGGQAEPSSQFSLVNPPFSKGGLGGFDRRGESPGFEIRFGLSENEIIHSRGLITKDEVRAVTIHKLKLPQKGIFWDIGAGSGSISIEAARLCPELKVFAIERDNEQIENIKKNEKKFNITNVEIIRGEAPDTLKDLPTPDRVLIGGSGGRLGDIVRFVDKKISSGIMVVNAVTIETLNEAMQCLNNTKFKVAVCEVSISRSKMINKKSHMSALNPIFIITGEKI